MKTVICFLFLGLFFINYSIAQKGKLVFDFEYEIEEGTLDIYQGNEFLKTYVFDSNSSDRHFELLVDPGSYSVKFSSTTPITFTQNIDKIQVTDSEMHITISAPFVDEYTNIKSTSDSTFFVLSFKTGNNFINQEKEFASQSKFSMKGIGTKRITNYFLLGGGYGLSYTRSVINKSYALTEIEKYNKEYYSSLNYDTELFFRFSAFNRSQNRLFLDVGTSYALPFYSRYYVKDGRTLTRTKNIQKFNNFQAIGRIGYSVFSLSLDYSLTDTKKNEHYEVPIYKIGFSILVAI